MQEVDNVLRILKQTKDAVERKDVPEIKSLSNQTIHTASITQDPDNILVAIVVYSLGKIIERGEYKEVRGWKNFYTTILSLINGAINNLEIKNEKKAQEELEKIRKCLNKLSGDMKKYIQDVFRKASINKASKIYEHGISMEKTANLLGVSMYEIASYAGQKGVSDSGESRTLSAKERTKLAMEMFGK